MAEHHKKGTIIKQCCMIDIVLYYYYYIDNILFTISIRSSEWCVGISAFWYTDKLSWAFLRYLVSDENGC